MIAAAQGKEKSGNAAVLCSRCVCEHQVLAAKKQQQPDQARDCSAKICCPHALFPWCAMQSLYDTQVQ